MNAKNIIKTRRSLLKLKILAHKGALEVNHDGCENDRRTLAAFFALIRQEMLEKIKADNTSNDGGIDNLNDMIDDACKALERLSAKLN